MIERPRKPWLEWLLMLVVVLTATLTRAWYLRECVDMGQASAPLQVQDSPPRPPQLTEHKGGRRLANELDILIDNLAYDPQSFSSFAPLSNHEEKTAHVAPGYIWLMALNERWFENPDMIMRWLQGLLGVLTALFCFLLARQAFDSVIVATIAGMLAALHPFWIINTAEINDGVLTTFLLSASLYLGTRASLTGGALAGLFFGLALAGLCLARAVMLPFALLAMMWFLLHSRQVKKGWFCALLAFLGFANGLAPWMVRNFQAFQRPVPIVDSAYYHLWMGNNRLATGGVIDEDKLRTTLDAKRLKELLEEPNQGRRYDMLSQEVLDEIGSDLPGTLGRRLWAGLYFVFGKAWFDLHKFAIESSSAGKLPAWLDQAYEGILRGVMLGLIVLALLGWRLSAPLHERTRLITFAAIWLPLPYLLSHAEMLSGPRLPLDVVLLTYSALAVAFVVPAVRRKLSGD